jgi:CheY-like chemotaxis protein
MVEPHLARNTDRAAAVLFLMGACSNDDTALRQTRILVVEHEALLRAVTVEFLRLSGYLVIEVASGGEAVAALASGNLVDVVFSDVCLPGAINGLVLVRWLHQQHPGLPIILATGYGNSVRQTAVQHVGDGMFLSKPYSQNELVRRIRSVLHDETKPPGDVESLRPRRRR